jgi:hypothetical protein
MDCNINQRSEVTRLTKTIQHRQLDNAIRDIADLIGCVSFLDGSFDDISFLDLRDTPVAFGSPGDVVAVNPTGDGLIFTAPGGGGGSGGLKSGWIAFNDVVQSSSLTYERVAAFPFPGTAIIPSLSKINALVRRNGAATSVSIRIYDATNALVIAEATGITTLDETAITDLGTISNLPAGEATFEIQLLRVGGPGGARAFCAGLEIRA